MLTVQQHRNACTDCGNEPVGHAYARVTSFLEIPLARMYFLLWRTSLYRLCSLVGAWVASRCMPLHFFCIHMLGITHFKPEIDESLSNRAKVLWLAAHERGVEIESGYTYGRPTEQFRVRFPAKEGVKKTRWFYFISLPLVPWKDRAYTQWIDDKLVLKEFFARHHIHVPMCKSVVTYNEACAAMEKMQETFGKTAAVVVKPRQGSRSRHTTIGVRTCEDMRAAFAKSRVISYHIVVEEQLYGKVCRATLIEGKLVGFTAMTHPTIVGDGVHTIAERITEKNERRNKRVQSELSIENPNVYPLAEKGYTFTTVLPVGEVFELKQKAGWMYGGEGREMRADVHPQLVKELEKAATLLHAQLVAFDVVIEDPESDPAPQTWGIIEANSVPYIEVHIMPTHGERINVALQLWDLWSDIPWGWR